MEEKYKGLRVNKIKKKPNRMTQQSPISTAILIFTICCMTPQQAAGIIDRGLAFDEFCVFIDDFAPNHGEEVLAFQFPSMKRCIFAL